MHVVKFAAYFDLFAVNLLRWVWRKLWFRVSFFLPSYDGCAYGIDLFYKKILKLNFKPRAIYVTFILFGLALCDVGDCNEQKRTLFNAAPDNVLLLSYLRRGMA